MTSFVPNMPYLQPPPLFDTPNLYHSSFVDFAITVFIRKDQHGN